MSSDRRKFNRRPRGARRQRPSTRPSNKGPLSTPGDSFQGKAHSGGYIYVAFNKNIPHLVKIGFTTRSPEERLAELSQPTGVPGTFTPVLSFWCPNPLQTEKRLHEKLKEFREEPGKEFFRLGLEQAQEIVFRLLVEERHSPVTRDEGLLIDFKDSEGQEPSTEPQNQGERSDGSPIGVGGAPEGVTVEWWIGQWLGTVDSTTLGSLYVHYAQLTRKHVIPAIGKVELARLTTARVQKMYKDKLAEGLSPATVRHIHAAVNQALGRALRVGLLVRNPCDMVDIPWPKPRDGFLTPQQSKVSIRELEAETLLPLVELPLVDESIFSTNGFAVERVAVRCLGCARLYRVTLRRGETHAACPFCLLHIDLRIRWRERG